MDTSDADGAAERLAHIRAERRHLTRLRAAERRDAVPERLAADHERHAEQRLDPASIRADDEHSADTMTLLLAEQAPLGLDRASLVADREVEDVFGMEF